MTPVVVLSAVGTALGVSGVLYALVGSRRRRETTSTRLLRDKGSAAVGPVARKLVPAGALGVVVLVVTRWPVAALLAGFAVVFAPAVLGRTSASAVIARMEAVAVWTELLRDTLAASAGLSEAVMATAPVAPPAIREEALRLADRLASGVDMTDALRQFAGEIDDPSCDMVVCALLLAVSSRAQKLADLLGALSESIREDVSMRLRVEAARASARSSVRTVVVFSVLFATALMVLARAYLAPFGTPVGQFVLAAVGVFYAGGIVLMVRMVRPPARARLLRTALSTAQPGRGDAP